MRATSKICSGAPPAVVWWCRVVSCCGNDAGVGDMVMATVRKGKPELRKKGKRHLILMCVCVYHRCLFLI